MFPIRDELNRVVGFSGRTLEADAMVEIPGLETPIGPGSTLAYVAIVNSLKVRIAELRLGNVEIELMEPLAEDSPISGFLDKRGEGIHHVCYRVEDAEALFTALRGRGVRTLTDSVRRVRGYAYFFVHPGDACGVLTEFKQLLEPSHDG